MNLIESGSTPDMIAWRIARTTYVVVVRNKHGNLDLVPDRGLNRPWSTKLNKLAQTVAQETGGQVCTYEEALKLLLKEYPDFEKWMHKRFEQKQALIDAENAKKSAMIVENVLRGQAVVTPPVPKNDVNPINPEY